MLKEAREDNRENDAEHMRPVSDMSPLEISANHRQRKSDPDDFAFEQL
jgi:hypothetical protein